MNLDGYLRAVERWIPGPRAARAERLAEVRTHLLAASGRGELPAAIERLGSPREAARAFVSADAFPLSSIWRRAVAYLADMVIVIAIAVALSVTAGLAELGDGAVVVLIGLTLWAFALMAIEYRFGRTPGKALVGIRVIGEDGTSPSLGEVVVRRLPLVFSGPLQIVDWCFAFAGDRRQRAFDRLARTLVVREPRTARTAVAGVATA